MAAIMDQNQKSLFRTESMTAGASKPDFLTVPFAGRIYIYQQAVALTAPIQSMQTSVSMVSR